MRYLSRRTGCRGYTLVEAMLVVAILGTVITVGSRMMIKTNEFFLQQNARVDVQRDLRAALDAVNRTLRQGKAHTVTVTNETDAPPYSKISFQTVEGSIVTFRQVGHKLYRDVGSQTNLLASNIEYIAFTYPKTDDNTVMSVSITLKKRTYLSRSAALQMAITKVRIMN